MKDQILIIGIVVALGVGYLMGSMHGAKTEIVQAPAVIPNNYDPARAIVTDALKRQEAATQACYRGWLEQQKQAH